MSNPEEVFVVVSGYDYEGSNVKKIFRNEDAARVGAKAEEKKVGRWLAGDENEWVETPTENSVYLSYNKLLAAYVRINKFKLEG